jgi:NAD(P)-dependent dehydrogenase (short-subunit alcohol dehydrogenase family)
MGVLNGQVAVVTGAAQGIGRAFACRLAQEGCHVVVTDLQDSVLRLEGEIGAAAHVGDVADADHVRNVVESTVAARGTIDVLVNNAGTCIPSSALSGFDEAEAQYELVFGSNTKGAFLFGRAVAPVMVGGGGGNIVNVSTDHVKPCPDCDRHHGHGRMDLYNASKWALNGLTFDWAKGLARHHVRVNNICMGATDTSMLRGFLPGEPDPEYAATWMQPEQTAQILVELLEEGPEGRTANSIGLYAGYDCVLPPPE